MKHLFALLILLSIAVSSLALVHSDVTYEYLWAAFKKQHNKLYASNSENDYRFEVFKNNLKYIEEHNAAGKSYTLAMNEFGDLTLEEFKARYLMTAKRPVYNTATVHVPKSKVPESWDWRNVNGKSYVVGVKNQGACGSCWAFATISTVESVHAIKTGELVELSVQQLVDCSSRNSGCNGGLPYLAYEYIIAAGGVDTAECYPYDARDHSCRFDPSCIGATISSYANVTSGSESDLLSAVYQTPNAVGIYAGSMAFQFYSGGVFYEKNCPNELSKLNHGVTVVGYGNENGKDYWLVKNSWGPYWGEGGYIKMARNEDNMCGIATMAAYPIA